MNIVVTPPITRGRVVAALVQNGVKPHGKQKDTPWEDVKDQFLDKDISEAVTLTIEVDDDGDIRTWIWSE